jgi:hypothetical protein
MRIIFLQLIFEAYPKLPPLLMHYLYQIDSFLQKPLMVNCFHLNVNRMQL